MERLLVSLNCCLPAEVRVLEVARVPPDFSARFSALTKTYKFLIDTLPVHDPCASRYRQHVWRPLDVDAMRWACTMGWGLGFRVCAVRFARTTSVLKHCFGGAPLLFSCSTCRTVRCQGKKRSPEYQAVMSGHARGVCRAAAKLFVGTHDFFHFAKLSAVQSRSSVRQLHRFTVTAVEGGIALEARGPSPAPLPFLSNLVAHTHLAGLCCRC
jgi:tRNA U38,U39,U40 pseudouridine synthase TruA